MSKPRKYDPMTVEMLDAARETVAGMMPIDLARAAMALLEQAGLTRKEQREIRGLIWNALRAEPSRGAK